MSGPDSLTSICLCFHLFSLYPSDGFWLFVMKSDSVGYIKHSCGLITDEMSVSVKAKPHFNIITRSLRLSLSLDSFMIPWRVFKDLNTGLSES